MLPPHTPVPAFGNAPAHMFLGSRNPKAPVDAGMDNVLASRLGCIATCAGDPARTDVGDNTDRGLILLRMLNEAGFDVHVRPPRPKCAMDRIERDGACGKPAVALWKPRHGPETPVCLRCRLSVAVCGGDMVEIPGVSR